MLRDYLIQKDLEKAYVEKMKEKIRSFKDFAIWGTGRGAKKLLQLIQQIGWNGELLFIDSNKDKWKSLYDNKYLIVSPDEYFDRRYKAERPIVISCADRGGVFNTIDSFGKGHENVLVSDLTSIELVGGESWHNYIWSNIENFSSAYELLEDDKSKNIFAALLNYRMSRDVFYLDGLVDELDAQYFDTSLFSINNLVLADCGAFTGDTIENFIKLTNGQYKRIYAFEPDDEIFKRLEKNIKNNRWSNVLAYNIGTYSKKAQLQFASPKDGTDMAGHISEEGNIIVNVDALDNIVHEDIGLIKMDIEGAEYDALLGCKGLIQKFKPILAICIYHRRDDYYKLINLVHSMNPDYKLYVRQYAYNDNETILYAV